MADGSAIEWTEASWNPVAGCTRAGPECDHCYAVPMSFRLEQMALADKAAGKPSSGKDKYVGLTVLNPKGDRHFNGTVRTAENALAIPLGWKKPRKIFVNSTSDLFHKEVPFDFIDRVFAVMALTPQHTYQILTKRPERTAEYLDGRALAVARAISQLKPASPETQTAWQVRQGLKWPLPNVWLGTSVGLQASADERIPHLVKCPAAKRFLSCEPLLGPLNLREVEVPHNDDQLRRAWDLHGYKFNCLERHDEDRFHQTPAVIDWVIVGGESGPKARPCNVQWVRSIVNQCREAGVACFVKQLGELPVSLEGFEWVKAFSHGARYQNLISPSGKVAATVFDAFDVDGHNWFVWDDVGGDFENSSEPTIEESKRAAEQSMLRSGLHPLRLKDRKGGNPAEWPADLRVRGFPLVEGVRS